MTLVYLHAPARDADAIRDVIERHGPARVLLAALAALLRPRARPPDAIRVVDLPDHLRRDIGLDVPMAPLPPQRAGHLNPVFRDPLMIGVLPRLD
ncbi:hypothetical protein [Jannaschia aquimarina]|nr:hypothetical protein [Jannaschia aquimarina]